MPENVSQQIRDVCGTNYECTYDYYVTGDENLGRLSANFSDQFDVITNIIVTGKYITNVCVSPGKCCVLVTCAILCHSSQLVRSSVSPSNLVCITIAPIGTSFAKLQCCGKYLQFRTVIVNNSINVNKTNNYLSD